MFNTHSQAAVGAVVDGALRLYARTPNALLQPLRAVCAHIPGQDGSDHLDDDDNDHGEGRDVIAEEVDQAAAAVAAAVLEAGAGAGRFMNRLDGAVATALGGPPESEFEVVEPANPAASGSGGSAAALGKAGSTDGATSSNADAMDAKEGGGLVVVRKHDGEEDEWPLQRVRTLCNLGVVVLTPRELVKALLLSSNSKTNATDSSNNSSGSSSSSSSSSGGGLALPWMVLDLRDGDPNDSSEDGTNYDRSSSSGGGSSREPCRHLALAKSLRLSPEVVEERPAQLEVWLQHFDAMKGTPLCLVDSCGEVLAQSLACSSNHSGQAGQAGAAGSSSSGANGGGNLLQRFGIGGNGSSFSTDQSRRDSHGRIQGPAMQLASVLAAQGFPSVAVLGGNFAELVSEVQAQNGTGRLEPLIIDLCAGAVALDEGGGNEKEDDIRNGSRNSPASPGSSGMGSPSNGFLSPFSSGGGSSRRSSVSSLVNSGRALVGSGQRDSQKTKVKHLQSPGEDALMRQMSFALRGAEARGHGTAALLLRKVLGVEQPLATTGELVQVIIEIFKLKKA